jgi:hypothetical protein
MFYKGYVIGDTKRNLKATALQGDTYITFNDRNIFTTSTIDHSVIGASGKIVAVSNVDVQNNTLTLTFDSALSENAVVRVKVRNI